MTIEQHFCQDVLTAMIEIPQGTLVGYKAMTRDQVENVQIYPSTPIQDWSAVYPQLNVKNALSYLSNQWERGHKTAQIVSLTSKKPFKMFIYLDSMFADGSIESFVKAERVRQAYESFILQEPQFPPLPKNTTSSSSLMNAFGDIGIMLCVLDAENFELVIPYSMFHQDNFQVNELFTFHQSSLRPLTIGRVEGFEELTKNELLDIDDLYHALCCERDKNSVSVNEKVGNDRFECHDVLNQIKSVIDHQSLSFIQDLEIQLL